MTLVKGLNEIQEFGFDYLVPCTASCVLQPQGPSGPLRALRIAIDRVALWIRFLGAHVAVFTLVLLNITSALFRGLELRH